MTVLNIIIPPTDADYSQMVMKMAFFSMLLAFFLLCLYQGRITAWAIKTQLKLMEINERKKKELAERRAERARRREEKE